MVYLIATVILALMISVSYELEKTLEKAEFEHIYTE